MDPVISVTKSPSPDTLAAPGGDVTFTVSVTNESTFEPVTLDALVDSIYGDLDGTGNCLADSSITLQPGETYRCRFTENVTGSAGSVHRNIVTATASDDDLIPVVVTGDAPAQVRIVAAAILPQPPTDMLLPMDGTGATGAGSSLAELIRLVVVLLAASLVVGALGLAVVRRADVDRR